MRAWCFNMLYFINAFTLSLHKTFFSVVIYGYSIADLSGFECYMYNIGLGIQGDIKVVIHRKIT